MKGFRELLLILATFLSINAQGEIPALLVSEKFPAGSGSTSDFSVHAFSHPMSGTRGVRRREFVVGNSFFKTAWVASPSSTLIRDGLGPLYNAVSCSSCHLLDGRGRGLPDTPGKVDISLLFRLRVKKDFYEVAPHPAYGEQFQPQGLQDVPGEGDVFVEYEKIAGSFADGETYELLKPIYKFTNLGYGPLGTGTITSPRVAPQMVGLGLIEAIKEEDIRALADPDDLDGDGISGRAHNVHSKFLGKVVLGRFGWKAGQPTLREQNAAAFNGDIGITTNLFPYEECTLVQVECQSQMTDLDVDETVLDRVTTYTQLISVPVRRDFESEAVTKGRNHFYKIQCQSCHNPSFTTSSEAELDILKDQVIYPYSDFLLHDMGDELADDKAPYKNEGEATTREWRTPPLWGLGLVPTVNGHSRYLHDGRARTLEEAILWHGGEGEAAKNRYLKLSKSEREELVTFLKSL